MRGGLDARLVALGVPDKGIIGQRILRASTPGVQVFKVLPL